MVQLCHILVLIPLLCGGIHLNRLPNFWRVIRTIFHGRLLLRILVEVEIRRISYSCCFNCKRSWILLHCLEARFFLGYVLKNSSFMTHAEHVLACFMMSNWHLIAIIKRKRGSEGSFHLQSIRWVHLMQRTLYVFCVLLRSCSLYRFFKTNILAQVWNRLKAGWMLLRAII